MMSSIAQFNSSSTNLPNIENVKKKNWYQWRISMYLFLVVQLLNHSFASWATSKVCTECTGWWNRGFPTQLSWKSWCIIFTSWTPAVQRSFWLLFLCYYSQWVRFYTFLSILQHYKHQKLFWRSTLKEIFFNILNFILKLRPVGASFPLVSQQRTFS